MMTEETEVEQQRLFIELADKAMDLLTVAFNYLMGTRLKISRNNAASHFVTKTDDVDTEGEPLYSLSIAFTGNKQSVQDVLSQMHQYFPSIEPNVDSARDLVEFEGLAMTVLKPIEHLYNPKSQQDETPTQEANTEAATEPEEKSPSE